MAERVHNQSDANISGVPSYSATQPQERDRVRDRENGAYLPELFVQTVDILKSEPSREVHRPTVSTAMWAWDLYLKIVVPLVKGVRRITWPTSHLL